MEDQTLDGPSRLEAVIWRPLLIEGLIGSGQHEQASVGLGQLAAGAAESENELAAFGLPGPVWRGSVLEMTNRESEVAHLIGQRMTNAEVAAQLFITPKAVEYHLGNIYTKYGLNGRQQLRRFLEEARRPALV